MIRYVCSIFDNGIQSFGSPVFVPHTGAATRSFADEVRRPSQPGQDNQLFNHPEDFDLYQLGEFDDQTGEFRSLDRPNLLLRGKDCAMKDS